jgi:hypothetical protein
MSTDPNAAALAQAWNTVTPYSQINTDSFVPEPGQYDLKVVELKPETAPNGLYAITGEYEGSTEGLGAPLKYTRTLYVGTKKDPMAALPETRLNSPALRFFKKIAQVNKVATNDQSDAALCKAITGKFFGCRIEATEYTGRDGQQKKGSEFGRNVTAKGQIPAKLDRVSATPKAANGQAGPVVTANTVPAGAFASE